VKLARAPIFSLNILNYNNRGRVFQGTEHMNRYQEINERNTKGKIRAKERRHGRAHKRKKLSWTKQELMVVVETLTTDHVLAQF